MFDDDANTLDEVFAEDVVAFLLERMRAGERVALVTLTAIDGGSPRPLGAQMGVSETGASCGYLSGGCVERAIVEEARQAMAAGASREVRYGKGSNYLDIVLPCGSAIDLYFDVGISEETLAGVQAALDARTPCAVTMDIPAGGAAQLSHDLGPTRRDGGRFIRRYAPALRLVIAGVGAAPLYLARLAADCGMAVRFLSSDEATRALAAPFAREVVAVETPEQRLELQADAWTAVAILFHDHDWEPRVLEAALASPAAYIGAMGSRRTHAQRLEVLEAMGVPAAQRARIRGPAGLSPRARSAPEIAASILAEIFHETRAAEADAARASASFDAG